METVNEHGKTNLVVKFSLMFDNFSFEVHEILKYQSKWKKKKL